LAASLLGNNRNISPGARRGNRACVLTQPFVIAVEAERVNREWSAVVVNRLQAGEKAKKIERLLLSAALARHHSRLLDTAFTPLSRVSLRRHL